MARVRGRDTTPELLVRRALWAAGVRYRLHVRGLPGKPDIVMARHRLAIFVHGCFWHRHPGCPGNRTPKSNVDFWETKLGANVARDAATLAALHDAGWSTLVVWECQARSPEALAEFVGEVAARINRPT